MKRILTTILCAQLLSANVVVAGENLDNAKKTVQNSLETAQNDAYLMAKLDLDRSLMKIMNEVSTMEDSSNLRVTLLDLENELKKSLDDIANLNAKDISKSLEDVMSVREKYQKLVRERFEASFRAAQHRFDNRKVINAISMIASDFDNRCKEGRSANGLNYHNGFTFENLPEYYSHFQIGYSSTGETNFSYGSSSATGSERSSKLQEYNSIIQTTTAVTSSIAYGGSATAAGMTASSASAVIGYAAAAAPYLIAVAVAFAIFTEFSMSAEQAKLQNDVADANEYLFKNMANDYDVNNFYTEACEKYSDIMLSMQRVLNQAQDTDKKNLLLKEIKLSSKERDSWKKDSRKNSENSLYLRLNRTYEETKCSNVDKNSFCSIDEENIWITSNNKIKLPIDEDDRKEEIEKFREAIKNFDDKYPSENVAKFVEHEISEVLIERLDSMQTLIKNISWKRLDGAQRHAFKKLIQILAIYRDYKTQENKSVINDIFADLEAQEGLEMLKSDFRGLVATMVNNILGHVSTEDVMSESKEFESKFKPFVNKYIHVSSVLKFEKQVKKLQDYYQQL